HVMLRVGQDGEFEWATVEFNIWMAEFVGDELWALGWAEDTGWLLVFDPESGELLDERPWDVAAHYNLLEPARDPAGGAWITAFQEREADDLVDQSLYRATTIDTLELVAMRVTEDPRQLPFDGVGSLADGAAVWWTGDGFEVVEPDGSVRWARSDG